jgi:hypothetical protein
VGFVCVCGFVLAPFGRWIAGDGMKRSFHFFEMAGVLGQFVLIGLRFQMTRFGEEVNIQN